MFQFDCGFGICVPDSCVCDGLKDCGGDNNPDEEDCCKSARCCVEENSDPCTVSKALNHYLLINHLI